MELEPFNLEKALAGHPLQLEDGTKIIKFVYIPEAYEHIQIVVVCEDGNTIALFKDGTTKSFFKEKNSQVLFMQPPPSNKHFAILYFYKEPLKSYIGGRIFKYFADALLALHSHPYYRDHTIIEFEIEKEFKNANNE